MGEDVLDVREKQIKRVMGIVDPDDDLLVDCFRRNEVTDDIYNRYPSFFERSDDLLIPDEPIERYLLIKEPTIELKHELNKYIATLDRKALEKEFIKRKAYNRYINLTEEEKQYYMTYPDSTGGGLGYIASRNEAVDCMPLDFWIITEFEGEGHEIVLHTLGLVLGLDMSDDYYDAAFHWGRDICHPWCMYYLMFNEYPIDIVKRNHAKVLDIPIPDGCSFEEKMDILSKSREPIHEGIRNAKSEMKSKIMDKTRAITLFDSLGIDKELQTEWINIIDEYCKEDDYKVIPYDWLAVAFDKSNTKLGYDISSILLKYNHYTYDLYGIIKLLPIQLFDNREFMKLAVQIDGLSISKNELYRNDDEIIRLAIDNDGDAITFLSEKYYRNEELVLLSLKRTWNEVFSKKEIRNYWKNNLDFAYKALNISSHYYKLFSTEIRNDDNFIKTAILKCAEENGGYYELYDYFSKENKLRLDLVIFALENDLYVDECELRRELRDSDELAEYCYKHDPNMLYGFSKRIRKKYNIKQ